MTQNQQLFYSAMLINIKGNSGKPKKERETRVRGEGERCWERDERITGLTGLAFNKL